MNKYSVPKDAKYESPFFPFLGHGYQICNGRHVPTHDDGEPTYCRKCEADLVVDKPKEEIKLCQCQNAK